MKKPVIIASVVVSVILALSTQISIVSLGTSLSTGSTQIVLRQGKLSNLPTFASAEQVCSGVSTGSMGKVFCEGGFAMQVRNGDQYLFGLPYMGFVHSLSMMLSAGG